MLSKNPPLNITFLPFLSHGHMIPMVDVARLFATLGASVTIITTAANAALFQKKIDRDLASGHCITFHILQWPGAESGLSENLSTAAAVDLVKIFETIMILQPQIERILQQMRPDCIVADMFYPWATDAAFELGIPRLCFHGSSYFALCAEESVKRYKPHLLVKSDEETFTLPGLPDLIQMTRLQMPQWSITPNSFSELLEIIAESHKRSFGLLMNSFYELENVYEEALNKVTGIRTWSIGPVSLLVNKDELDKTYRGENPNVETSELLEWLTDKEPNSVLYISFGSMVKLKPSQIVEIAHAVEVSGQNFIWVVQKEKEEAIDDGFPKGFEKNMEESKKGLIIRGWAPQLMILEHEAVGGFITHCGWNSILECITAGLPMITWPLFAEQFYNEKLITDVLKIGVAVGSKRWWNLGEELESVKRGDIGKAIALLMGGSDEAVEMRKRARELGDAAKRAVSIGGLSQINLVSLLEELHIMKLNRGSNRVGKQLTGNVVD